MTTLAQRLVNGEGALIEDMEMHIYVLDRLAPRKNSTVLEARGIADKFVFEHSPANAIYEQISNKVLDRDLIWNTARPITQPMWVEWSPTETIQYGFLIDTTNQGTIITFCAGSTTRSSVGRAGAVMQITLPAQLPCPDLSKFGKVKIHYNAELLGGKDTTTVETMAFHLVKDCLCAMFVLCTPRVADTQPLIPARPVRRRQAREYPDKPIIEFRTVKMRIGVAPQRYVHTYDPTGLHEAIHRRLHRVVGHYRVYTKNHEQPLVSFVPEHWRGDPELGIVLHNREVHNK